MRLRSTRGQSAIEFVGILLIAAVFILAIARTGLGKWVEKTVRTAVCRIDGGHCSGGGTSTSADPPHASPTPNHLDPTAPHSGPPIGDGLPVGGLPFPGSVSGGGEADPFPPSGVDPKTGEPTKSPIKVSGKFTQDRSKCTENAAGQPQVSLSGSVQIQVEGGGKGEHVGGSVFDGRTTQYSVTTDPKHADDITSGRSQPPNPRDPRSIPQGSAIALNQQSYQGAKGSIAYHNITAELGYKDGRQVSSSVKRLDSGHVQITVGDSKLVENSLGLTVGIDEANAGVSLTQGVSDGKTRSVDIDISTPQGWNAYQSFIETGKLPADGAAGTANPTTSRVLNFTSADELKAHLGPVDVTFGGSHLDASVVETTHPDGSKQDTLIDNHGQTQLVQSYDSAPDGTVSNERYAIRLQDPKGAFLPDGTDHGTPTDGRDITFTYTPSQLQEMQNAAIDDILAASKHFHAGEFKDGGTREQVRQYLMEHPYDYNLPNVGSITMNPAILAMAGARDVSEVAWALLLAARGNSTEGMLFMEEFSALTKRSRHELGLPPGQDPLKVPTLTNRPKGC